MFLLLFALWLLFNGRITLEICLFGAVVCGALTVFSARYLQYRPAGFFRALQRVPPLSLLPNVAVRHTDSHALLHMPEIIAYAVRLVREILLSACHVSRMIWLGQPLNPALITMRSPLHTRTAQVTLANSITLTPGTLTVELNHNRYLIHQLDPRFSLSHDESVFEPALQRLEGGADE